MKISYFSGSTLPSQQANSVHVMKMCRAFASGGHEVTLFAFGRKEVFEYYGVERTFTIETVATSTVKGIAGVVNAYRMVAASVGVECDLVYSRNLYASYLARNSGRKFIFESHGVPRNALQRFLLRRILRARHLVRLVVISDALRSLMIANFPEAADIEILVAHDGADAEEVDEQQNSTLCVGYIGSLYRGRGIEVILGAASQLREFDFHLVGGQESEVERWRERKTENVTFHGFIPHGELDRLLRSFDVVLAPYQADTATAGGVNSTAWMSPMKIFEYMAGGKAIVCSDLPVLREVLKDGENALLVEADEVGAWVNAIRRCSSEELRRSLGSRARQDLEQSYTWSKRAKNVLIGLDA